MESLQQWHYTRLHMYTLTVKNIQTLAQITEHTNAKRVSRILGKRERKAETGTTSGKCLIYSTMLLSLQHCWILPIETL